MENINILVTSKIGEENLRRIMEINSQVKVFDTTGIWSIPNPATYNKDSDSTNEEFNALLAEAEILFGFRLPPNVIMRAPKLKWIQAMTAGVNYELTDDIVKSKVILTNTSGIHTIQGSELVAWMMLTIVKDGYRIFRLKQEKQWKRFTPTLLHSKTLGIIGLGSIGRGVAHLGKAFGMKVLATRRSAVKISRAKNVDVVYPGNQMKELIGKSDFVVLCLPSTAETLKLIGEPELRAMKPTAYLINIGRGDTVDEEALVRALEQGWIAGAGLDVFTKEPLPLNSKLWGMPTVITTPHIAGDINDYATKATELFCENLQRYISGKRLHNIVNKTRGY